MILGLVCARAGSKGLPGKNILPLRGKPLLNIALEKAIACTDVAAMNTDLPFPPGDYRRIHRPSSLAGDSVSKWAVWQHSVERVEAAIGKVEAIVDIDVSRPLTTFADVLGTIRTWEESPEADVVMAIAKADRNPYFDLLEDVNGKLVQSKACDAVTRQAVPAVYQHGGIYVVERDFLMEATYFYDGEIRGYEIPRYRSLDVDDETDWRIIEALEAA